MAAKAQFETILSKLAILEPLSGKVDSLVAQVDGVAKSLGEIKRDVEANSAAISANVQAIRDTNQDVEDLREEMQGEFKKIKSTLNRKEQQLKSTTIRIFNVLPSRGEADSNWGALGQKIYDRFLVPLLRAASEAGDLGSVPAYANVVESCYRQFVKEPDVSKPPPPVIVRLCSRALKIAILKQRKNALPTPTPLEREKGIQRFIIVEELTGPAHSLLRLLSQDPRTEKVWSMNGQIFYTLQGKSGYRAVKSVFDTVEEILG